MNFQKIGDAFSGLAKTIKALRTPETGCPWDLEQTHESLRPYLLEEAHEVLQAIDRGDDQSFCEELGDLLLQVVLHAQVATDRNAFGLEEIVQAIDEKMIRRHPHVFGEDTVSGSAEVLENWEAIKIAEKGEENNDALPYTAKLSDVPLSLPALVRSQRLGEKAAKFQFDWNDVAGVLAKVKEELGELEAEIQDLPPLSGQKSHPNRARQVIDEAHRKRLEHELGDLLFSVCDVLRQ